MLLPRNKIYKGISKWKYKTVLQMQDGFKINLPILNSVAVSDYIFASMFTSDVESTLA